MILLQNHKCIFKKEFKCVKKVELSIFNSVVRIKPPSLEAMHSIHTLAYVAHVFSACFVSPISLGHKVLYMEVRVGWSILCVRTPTFLFTTP